MLEEKLLTIQENLIANDISPVDENIQEYLAAVYIDPFEGGKKYMIFKKQNPKRKPLSNFFARGIKRIKNGPFYREDDDSLSKYLPPSEGRLSYKPDGKFIPNEER